MHKKRLLPPLAALAFCMLTGVAHAQTSPQMLADLWTNAYNRHDRAALGALYTEDAKLMMHGSPTIAGRTAIETFWASDFEVDDPLTLLTVTNTVTGSDMLLVHGDYKVIARDDGRQLGFGRFAHVWTRDGTREWRLDRDLWNQPYEAYDVVAHGEDIQGLADQWSQAYNRFDQRALAGLYGDDGKLMMHGAPTIRGRRAIGDFWGEDFQEGNPLTLLTVTHAVDGLDMRLVHGNYEVVNRDDGTKLGFGRFSHIWFENADGRWELDLDLWLQRYEPY